ncbi:STAS domain-containing protein [Streptomyces sp. NPDC059352]|uniref:STAS domain-containing protein n=1 Tax=Streptomyces sp. NPDC059352 TaxID=3346810 RepID=UPI00367DF4AF
MLINHTVRHDVLHVTLHRDLDVTNRAAVALQVQALVQEHRPSRVIIAVPTAEPTPATLSALARAHRMCASLGIPLTLSGASARTRRLLDVNTP